MDTQDKAILKGLVAVAWVDGQVHEGEHEHIEALINAFGADEAEATEIRDFAKEPKGLVDIPITDLSRDDRRAVRGHAGGAGLSITPARCIERSCAPASNGSEIAAPTNARNMSH